MSDQEEKEFVLKEHERELVNLRSLKFDEANPNEMTAETIESLKYSLEKWGMVDPIVIDQNNLIANGEHRVKALIDKGINEVKVIRYHFKNDAERKLFRQTMNKLRGRHNFEKDAMEMVLLAHENELQELSKLIATNEDELQNIVDQQMDAMGMSENNNSREETEADLDALPVAEEIQEPITKQGDIWKLGKHYLMCGDCTKKEDVDKLLQGKTVDLLLTDPPYGVNYSGKNEFLNVYDKGNHIQKDIENDDIKDYEAFFTDFLGVIPFSDYNIFYVFMSGFALHQLRKALDNNNLTWADYLVWVKNNHVLGRKDYNAKHEFIVYGWRNHHKFYGDFSTTILEFDKPHKSDLHPVMKPIKLLEKLIGDGSIERMVVFDPFMESGSTLIACEQTNRICYGLELDPRYCDVIVTRWENITGQKAERLQQQDLI